MNTKMFLHKFFNQFILTCLIFMTIILYNLLFFQNAIAYSQINTNPFFQDSCKITDSTSAYLWGAVYYRGAPIQGADVSFNINGETIQTVTQPGSSLPTYCMSSMAIDEVIEITAKFAGQRVNRSVRISPGEDQKQQVNLVIPKRSVWDLWRVNTEVDQMEVTKNGQFLIVGSQTGIIWLDKDTMRGSSSKNVSKMINAAYIEMPRLDKTIRDIAIHHNGTVWAITDDGLFSQQNAQENSWVKQPVPITGTLNALAIDMNNDVVWVGGGESQREVAVYLNGEWSHIYTTDADIRELTVDRQSNLWVGTWGSGVYKHDSQGEWFHYQIADGLVSNYIHTIMAATQKNGADVVWFGAGYAAGSEKSQGSIGYHNPADNEWRIYGVEQGLPENSEEEGIAEDVEVFTIDEDGIVWAGTNQGLYLLGNEMPGRERWVLHDSEINGHVTALTYFNRTVVVATDAGLMRLVNSPELLPLRPIVFQMAERTDGLLRLQIDSTNIMDESTNVVWSWVSNHNGPLCTTAEICLFPTDRLKIGRHEIELRVQNDIGGWSTSDTLRVSIGYEVYLPAIRNGQDITTLRRAEKNHYIKNKNL